MITKLFTGLKDETMKKFTEIKLKLSTHAGRVLKNAEVLDMLVENFNENNDQKGPFPGGLNE